MDDHEEPKKPMSMIGVAIAGFIVGVILEVVWDSLLVRGLTRRGMGWQWLPSLGQAYPYMLLAAGVAGSIACTIGIHEIEHSKPNRIGPKVASGLGFICVVFDLFLRWANHR
jgi:hypothetical protein